MDAIEIRILLVGESGSGKSQIVHKLLDDPSLQSPDFPTLGSQNTTYSVDLDGDLGRRQRIVMRIVDIGGSEKTRASQKRFMSGISACLFVFDLCDRASFTKINSWIRDISEASGGPGSGPSGPNAHHKNMVRVLVGNKSDMAESIASGPGRSGGRQVTETEARSFSETHGLHYIETSAIDGTNIKPLFLAVGDKIVDLLSQGLINCADHDVHGVRYSRIGVTGRNVGGGGNGGCPQLGFFGQWCDGC